MTSYEQRIANFVAPYSGLGRHDAVVACYHNVRNFSYLSDGVRDPEQVLIREAGSCSGKHIILRDSLLALGEDAQIETVEGDFAAGVPVHATMSSSLKQIIETAQIRDFHQFVLWKTTGENCRLDATWPDAMAEVGFTVNTSWQGSGHTELALSPTRFCGQSDDIMHSKAGMLAALSPEERESRLVFLQEFSKWVATINPPKGGNNVD